MRCYNPSCPNFLFDTEEFATIKWAHLWKRCKICFIKLDNKREEWRARGHPFVVKASTEVLGEE